MAQLNVVSQPEYALHLTDEELHFLFDLLYGHVSGSPDHSRRKYADRIVDAMMATYEGDLEDMMVRDMREVVRCDDRSGIR